MPRKAKEHLINRNRQLLETYRQLSQEGYANDKILQELSKQFFLAERTVYGIISGEYERRKQKSNIYEKEIS